MSSCQVRLWIRWATMENIQVLHHVLPSGLAVMATEATEGKTWLNMGNTRDFFDIADTGNSEIGCHLRVNDRIGWWRIPDNIDRNSDPISTNAVIFEEFRVYEGF